MTLPPELHIGRGQSPWSGYTASHAEEAAWRHIAAVAIAPHFEVPPHLAGYATDGRPWLAIDRVARRVVVDATSFTDLDRADATRLESGACHLLGHVRDSGLLRQPSRLARFLLEAQLVQTYWHVDAVVRLRGENDDGVHYRADFDAVHTYFTHAAHERPYSFAMALRRSDGAMEVVASDVAGPADGRGAPPRS